MKLLILLLIASALIGQKRTYVQIGKMLDVKKGVYLEKVTLVMLNKKIEKIETGFVLGTDSDLVIDLKTKYVLPGFIDLHTHLSGEQNKNSYTEDFFMNLDDYAYRSTIYAERTLMAGFTTVRELGGVISTSLRNNIKAGYIKGPRIFSAGTAIATTGGHADPTNGVNFKLMGDPNPKDGVINGADEARKAVRQRYKEGADCIKITATGGVLSLAKSGMNPQFFQDEMDAIVQTAKEYGMHVAAHAHGAEGMKRAIKAGVRTIEHGTLMDDETFTLMKKYGTYYVPTLMAGDWVSEKAKINGYFPEMVRTKAADIGPKILATVSKAYKFGIKIAFGTDSGVSAHGDNAKEFELLVKAGLTPIEAIRAATLTASEVLDMQDNLGSLDIGKFADLVGVDSDPLLNISILQHVTFVMKEAVVYKK